MKIISLAKSKEEKDYVAFFAKKLNLSVVDNSKTGEKGEGFDNGDLFLLFDGDGVALSDGKQSLKGDFSRLLPRLKENNLRGEVLFKAARFKDKESNAMTVVDGTAGLGEDSFLLAASGYNVTLIERNPIVSLLLSDALRRGLKDEKTAPVCARMKLIEGDSEKILPELAFSPDIVLLDPMFPERRKSSLVKKKLQLIQRLEHPCTDEKALLEAAKRAKPKKIVVKRPSKGDYLAHEKPTYSVGQGGIRYDCYVSGDNPS